jgi:DNA mismatch repair protein MutS
MLRERGLEPQFQSILFEHELWDGPVDEPDCFSDLRLDQIVSSVLAGREDYQLTQYFYRPLHDPAEVRYRHDVLADLEHAGVRDAVTRFVRGMQTVRDGLAFVARSSYPREQQRWFLESAARYCQAVVSLAEELDALTLCARGFRALCGYLTSYIASDTFGSLVAETHDLVDELAAIRYAVHIKGSRVRVSAYDGEPDMSDEVEHTFAKFKRGASEEYRVRFRDRPEMNHVEAQIAELVARLFPDAFQRLRRYCEHRDPFLDQTIVRFDREVQFFLAYLEYIEPLQTAGLTFSHPRVADDDKAVHASDTFDLALATKLQRDGASVVTNGFRLVDPERILVVSGPNNGGKTTFARMFGQLHYLASLGLPVPGSQVRLTLPDRIFTHFEREERIETLRGKFEDELVRIREILAHATGNSVLIMNESFGSTALRDALDIGMRVVGRVVELDALCVFVTFIDELASLGESTVSMMSTVDPGDPARRAYKIVRKPADGLAYAAAIADKYGLGYESLRRRVVTR